MDRLVGGVGVVVPSREAATGDVNPQPVPPQKNVARRPEIYLMTLCSTGAEDAVAQVEGAAVGVDVAQPDDPIGGGSSAVRMQHRTHATRHLQVALQRR